jgi:hypothetical protein
MTAIVGVAVISAMTSSPEAHAMEVPFWYETDLITGESYYVDHFNEGKKSWVKATPQAEQKSLPVQGIGEIIQTHSAQDLEAVSNAEELSAQELKDIKTDREADRTYDLLALYYPGLYPEREDALSIQDIVINQAKENIEVKESIITKEPSVIRTPVPEIVVPIPEPIVPVIPVPIPEVVIPIPEVVVPIPEAVPIIPEAVPIVPEIVVPIPDINETQPTPTPQLVPSVNAPPNGTGAPTKQDMTSDDWDEFLKDMIPADRPLESIEDFFD